MGNESSGQWPETMGRRLSRRSALRGTAVAGLGLAGAALLGCSSKRSTTAPAAATAASGRTAAPTADLDEYGVPAPAGDFATQTVPATAVAVTA